MTDWSGESDILPVVNDESSIIERRGMKAVFGNNTSGMDNDDTYTSLSSTTSSSDAMLDARIELAEARKAEATAKAELALLKVAKAAKKAGSTSSIQSNNRSRSERFEQRILFTPPKGRVDFVIQGGSPEIHSNAIQQQSLPLVGFPAMDSAALHYNQDSTRRATAQPSNPQTL